MEIIEVAVDLAPGPGRPTAVPPGWVPDNAIGLGAAGHRGGSPGTTRLRCGPLEVSLTTVTLGSGRRTDLVVHNPAGPGRRAVSLDRLRLRLTARPRRVLEHGWQSWSPVTRCSPATVRPLRRLAPAWVRGTYHAVPELGGRAVCGDQFLLAADGCGPGGGEGGVAGFLHGAAHLSTVVASPEGLWVVALLDGVALEPGQSRSLDPLWLATGDPGPLYSEYLTHWAAVAGARTAGASPLGWCSWYQYFWKVTPEGARANLAQAAAHGFELFQLDDGYQRAIGDWLEPNAKFAPDQVPRLAADIAGAGLEAGIWTAPFLASPRSALVDEHPEWLARRRSGRGTDRPCRAMFNPLAWGGWAMALDTTHPAVLDHLRATFAGLVEQGWSYHKIDFCYAAAMPARRHGDGRLTRAQSLRAGIEAVREGIGEGSTLLGCGIPLAQSVGLVDAMRVSPDTAPSWRPGLARLPGYPDLAPSAVAALAVGVLRAPMHRRLWVNDPDCLMLRPTDTRLTADQRAVLAAAVAGTGGFTLISDDLSVYGPSQWSALARLRTLHAAGDTPLDLADPFAPAPVVQGAGGLRLEVQWDDREAAGPPPPAPVAGERTVVAGGRPGRAPWARLALAPGDDPGPGPIDIT